jgi:hypothetical protein
MSLKYARKITALSHQITGFCCDRAKIIKGLFSWSLKKGLFCDLITEKIENK